MEGDLQRALGRSVRRLRVARGLLQEEFAEELAVHRTFVGSIERGERNLTLRSVERLCQQLGVEPLELLAEDPPSRGRSTR